jgi:hypothetical protein
VAARKKARGAARRPKTDATTEKPSELRLIANLLGLLAVRGESKQKQMVTLAAAGFTPADVATLLRTTPNAVSVALYKERRGLGDRE